MNSSGGRFAGCVGECLARVVPRMEICAFTSTDFADPRGGELLDSVSDLCGPERRFLMEAFDDASE